MRNQTFVGIENIERLIADPLFWTALWNTAYFAAGSLLLQLPVALALALLLSSTLPVSAETWKGLVVAPEHRCAPYDSEHGCERTPATVGAMPSRGAKGRFRRP